MENQARKWVNSTPIRNYLCSAGRSLDNQAKWAFQAWLPAIIALVAVGCAVVQKPATPQQRSQAVIPAQEKAIKLRIKADPKLNWFENEAHTLVLCIYQLGNTKLFNAWAKNPEKLSQLVECEENPLGDDVTDHTGVEIGPSEIKNIPLDRAENTRYLGITAGYFESKPKDMTQVIPIPIIHKKTGAWLWKEEEIIIKPLDLELKLGPRAIIQATTEEKKEQPGKPTHRKNKAHSPRDNPYL